MAITVKGLDKALKDIEKKGDLAIQAVKDKLADTAESIELDAKLLAPNSISSFFDGGESGEYPLNVKQRINKVALNEFQYKVGIEGTQDFDAYAEFGTGQDAQQILNGPGYTDEMRAIARVFYKNGQGTLIGKPFLMPSFIKNTANLVEEMEADIKKAIE
jgi:hypothetical protein